MGIYDAMKQCKADVSTVCLGLAASMGAFLLASGSKGKRYCMPNSKVMIHQPLGTAGGKVRYFDSVLYMSSLMVCTLLLKMCWITQSFECVLSGNGNEHTHKRNDVPQD